jgi:hypothetical protein
MKTLEKNEPKELTYNECLTINGGSEPGDGLKYIAYGFSFAVHFLMCAWDAMVDSYGSGSGKGKFDAFTQSLIECPVSVHEWN